MLPEVVAHKRPLLADAPAPVRPGRYVGAHGERGNARQLDDRGGRVGAKRANLRCRTLTIHRSDSGLGRPGFSERVLDVGCGAGTLIEAAVFAGADAVGVDISSVMVEAARRRVPTATVVTADAQTADLLAAAPGAPFDRVVSRFGVMFFADPHEAFANIRSATTPGARLVFVCWREGETEMFSLGLRELMARLVDPPTPPMPGAPGPMGLANADRIREVLTDAGWSDVTITPIDGLCDYAIDGSDGVEERMAIVLSGTVGRAVRAELEPRLDPAEWQAVLDEARAELRARLVDGTLRIVGHTWLVTAQNRSGS
jgi:SAM-dependent methyltransferase